ncbi:hypothetical protein GCM10009630_62850 [Kribbella jejuensis]|uniref:Uncharacterized protein n=1 Tax=Kribbella jejuensis TaxID=236068 RepID=A0A542EAQ2_9ACTN|nr:hypothetical protein [Kribbella jejuensis]TQJ12407.1 hypothetical protein FB475_5350 [Kribbella jejuensis]
MRIPFTARGHNGTITVEVSPNDPAVSGHALVVPDLELDAFRGFPMCTASVSFAGQGINAIFGWIQVVDNGGSVSVDLLPNLDPTDPFYVYGYLPTFFDAPANPDHTDGVWRATTFLVMVPDVIRSRVVEPLAAFTWGYELHAGQPRFLKVVALDGWAGHHDVLASTHPTWTFR